jgi:RimJ/RimL family protein N-acetyltransferase/8-oxo-dGTP pyrophosphatase MutT (NUDIX family)
MSFENVKINCAVCWMVRRVNSQLEYLLIRRCGPFLKGNWQPPTGKLEEGEKAWLGALREGFEETGIYPESFYSADHLEIFYMHEFDKLMFAPNFVGFCKGDEDIRLAPREHDQYAWLSYAEARERLDFNGQIEAIDAIELRFSGKPAPDFLKIGIPDRNLVIETERMILRPITYLDLEPLAEMMAHPEVMEYSLKGPISIEEVKIRVIGRNIISFEESDIGIYACFRRGTDEFLGFAGAFYHEVDGEKMPEIGYRFHRYEWGKGYATEAASAIYRLMNKKGIERIISIIDPANQRSIRVAEKMGAMIWKRTNFHGNEVDIYKYPTDPRPMD